MNQKFGQIRKRERTCEELLAAGTTLGEHNRQLREAGINRALSAVILIGVLASVAVGALVLVTG